MFPALEICSRHNAKFSLFRRSFFSQFARNAKTYIRANLLQLVESRERFCLKVKRLFKGENNILCTALNYA